MSPFRSALFLALMLCAPYVAESATEHQFVIQKDLSEHCRRRALPSVLLARRAVEGHSQILHFSQLEVPYSCYISIRTETGSNIVLVIQVAADENLKESCKVNNNQLLVYELGETFGGYWGPLPDSVSRESATVEKYYTLKTSRSTHSIITEESAVDIKVSSAPTPPSAPLPWPAPDYVELEVPLLNVSGRLVAPGKAFDVDPVYEVGERWLTHPYNTRKNASSKRRNYSRYNANRRLKFKKTKRPITNKGTASFMKKKFDVSAKRKDTLSYFQFSTATADEETISEPLKYIADVMKNLKTNSDAGESNLTILGNLSPLLHKISDVQHNVGVKAPKLTVPLMFHDNVTTNDNSSNDSLKLNMNYTSLFRSSSKITPNARTAEMSEAWDKIYTTPYNTNSTFNILTNNTTSLYREITKESTSHIRTVYSKDKLADTSKFKNTDIEITQLPYTDVDKYINILSTGGSFRWMGSMVDHESWENVVQAAPVIAGLLNNSIKSKATLKKIDTHMRRKRRIQSIRIQHARPHTISTGKVIDTTPESVYRFSDIQEFAQMVELQDDDMYGHVALRYLGKYVGNTLFNICENAEARPRHVYLINTSRIAVAINKFTLKRMTIVATAANTVVSPATNCAGDQIECQVSGTRVCIDEMAACDGVPNCGSYDIYDEDKLRCGAHKALQHNVYIAAFTLLAALLTMLYIVHYWLKRCVPKVSDAFFIYTEGSENFLYLDSIMRSPNEIDEDSKMIYQGHLFEDDIDSDKKGNKSICSRIKKFFVFCFARRSKIPYECTEIVRPELTEPKRMYSFAEIELSKMMRLKAAEAGVQTGDSLELQFCRELKKESEYTRKTSTKELKKLQERSFDSLSIKDDFPVLTEDFSRKKSQDSELNMLKFFRDARSVSGQLSLVNKSGLTDAIKTVSHTILEPETTADVVPGSSKSPQKRLRFDSTITTIPSVEIQVNDNDNSRKSLNQEALDVIEKDREHGGRDFMRFWGNKGKKNKKKSHLSLR